MLLKPSNGELSVILSEFTIETMKNCLLSRVKLFLVFVCSFLMNKEVTCADLLKDKYRTKVHIN
jgi:hypothetical protein